MARAAHTLQCLSQWRCHSDRPSHARSRRTTVCEGGGNDVVAVPFKSLEKARSSKVLVLGGTGRTGGSTAIALSRISPSLRIVIAGRNRTRGDSLVSTIGENSEFLQVDIDEKNRLQEALDGVDMFVHTAGPFQQAEKRNVLEAAINTKTPYVDVCDDADYSRCAKSLHKNAIAAGIPAIITCGIYPGVSNVMAAELVRAARNSESVEPEKLKNMPSQDGRYLLTILICNSLKSLGTGGAGPTILSTSFLLLGEDVIAYNKGEEVSLKPYSGMINVDFGRGIRKRDVFLLNLPEVRSAHEILGVPTVSARFGTTPFFWNWGMSAIGNFVPVDFLRNRNKVQKLVQILDPFVRAVDSIAGERVSMRIDLECSNGQKRVGIFSHKKLSVSVGNCTAAFVLAVLEGSSQPGVWFPEEPEGLPFEAREIPLKRASQGTINFAMNKAPWMVETNPKEIGLGIFMSKKNE